ncbi:MAG TPA: TetR family transcriptional regulator, partial [Polyangiaceae bacterium]
MARPVNADADKTKTRILDSATLLFAERGLGSTSVRDVAGAANVSLAMVNHYFGSKDGLYDACISAMFDELRLMQHVLAEQVTLDAPVDELVSHAVRAMFAYACDYRTAVRLLVRDAASSGEVSPRGRGILLDMLYTVTNGLGARLGRAPDELRLPLQSIVFLVARYAAQAENELCLVAGMPAKEKARAKAAVEAHLVDVAYGLLGVNDSKKKNE